VSGGGSQTSNSVSEFKPPDYTQPGWQDYLNSASQLAQSPQQQYMGQKVAGINGNSTKRSSSGRIEPCTARRI